MVRPDVIETITLLLTTHARFNPDVVPNMVSASRVKGRMLEDDIAVRHRWITVQEAGFQMGLVPGYRDPLVALTCFGSDSLNAKQVFDQLDARLLPPPGSVNAHSLFHVDTPRGMVVLSVLGFAGSNSGLMPLGTTHYPFWQGIYSFRIAESFR